VGFTIGSRGEIPGKKPCDKGQQQQQQHKHIFSNKEIKAAKENAVSQSHFDLNMSNETRHT
jgi:hypothetical protein